MALKTVQMDIYDGQMLDWHRKASYDPHRFKVVVAGRKARKTTFMVNELCYSALTDPRNLVYLFVAPFRQQAKEIVWEDHLAKILFLCHKFNIETKINRSELWVEFYAGGKPMSRFQVSGADNAEALRGKSNWGGVALDEYASIKPYVWKEIVRPNLQVHKAYAIIGGTPKGYGNDLYTMAKLGDHNNVIDSTLTQTDPDFITFHATSYDNQYTETNEIESAKRQTTVDYFNQEYLALFTRFTGLVYPEFNISDHVQPVEHIFNEHADYMFGLDFAVRGFTAAVTIRVDTKGEIWILDAYKKDKATAKEHIPQIKQMLVTYADLTKYTGYADPAGWARNQQDGEMIWSLADEYLEEEMPITRANNEVVAGINYLRQLFKANKIHIDPKCTELIDEIMQYQWKDQNPNQEGLKSEPEEVRKVNDHLVDALRYALYSKPQAPDALVMQNTGLPITFPPPRHEEENEDSSIDVFEEMNIPSFLD